MNVLGVPELSLWVSSLLIVVISLVVAMRFAQWRQILAVSSRQHMAYAAVLILAIFWLMQVEVRGLLSLHPLGITTLVMVFGWSFALIIGACADLLNVLIGGENWRVIPVNIVLSVIIPATVTRLLLVLIGQFSVKNLFVYMLGAGFGGAMLSIQVMGVAGLALFYLTNSAVYLAELQQHYLLLVLLTFPEGFINGMLVTMLTVFSPDLLKTYNDHDYLDDN